MSGGLRHRLAEPSPGRIQLVTGPRQVGKTTLLLELAAQLGERAIYVAADGPEAALPGFWERLWNRAEETAALRGRTKVVLVDEVQHLADWAARLKAEWDRLRRKRLRVHVVATGSSALRLASGSKESLAGRFERLTLTHWSAAALAETFGLAPDDAAELVVRMGAYPGAMELRNDMPRWPAYVGRRYCGRSSPSPRPRRRRSCHCRSSRDSSRIAARSRPSRTTFTCSRRRMSWPRSRSTPAGPCCGALHHPSS